MGGERTRQRAEEVVAPDGLELVGHLHRAAAGFDHRPRGPGEAADVGVRTTARTVPVVARDVRLAAPLAERAAADVAVAVPLGAAVAQAHAVDHAVADEPVVLGRVGDLDRVRPVAQVAAVELGGELADHRAGRTP